MRLNQVNQGAAPIVRRPQDAGNCKPVGRGTPLLIILIGIYAARRGRPSVNAQTPPKAQAVLDFWFSDATRRRWFNATPTFDETLRTRFLDTFEQAEAGGLRDWAETPDGALALVIVLDQFPLNLFRNQARSFGTEAAARSVAFAAIERGLDQQLKDSGKAFLYLPFMHSEDLADQDRSVALFEAAGLRENLRFAHHHRNIVARFGRFPHRNAALGRTSTQEEIDWLNSPGGYDPA